jgi:opacity protein-like surface antigen
MKRIALIASVVFVALLVPARAFADITAFLGVNPTPVSRPVRGFSVGVGLVIVGFEFEYANSNDDIDDLAPRLQTYMGNGLLQTPFPIARMQFYATAGGGVYHESFDNAGSETNVGINVGGGVKISLAGPLRLRLDYRVFTLQGSPQYEKPQRFYAGINLKF